MATKQSACLAAKHTKEPRITTVVSGPADTPGDDINSLSRAVAALRASHEANRASHEANSKATQQVLSQLDSMKGYCDDARINQHIAPIQAALASLTAKYEQSERQHKALNIIMKGFRPAEGLTPRQLTDTIQKLLTEYATNKEFKVVSVTPFGNNANGPRNIRMFSLVFPSANDKHAAYTASRKLRAEKVQLDDDLTADQQQQRKVLFHIHTQLRQRGLHPFWRGGVLCCIEEGECKRYTAEDAARTPPAPQQPYPRHPSSRVRRRTMPPNSSALASATAAAAAALAPSTTSTAAPTSGDAPAPEPVPVDTNAQPMLIRAFLPESGSSCICYQRMMARKGHLGIEVPNLQCLFRYYCLDQC